MPRVDACRDRERFAALIQVLCLDFNPFPFPSVSNRTCNTLRPQAVPLPNDQFDLSSLCFNISGATAENIFNTAMDCEIPILAKTLHAAESIWQLYKLDRWCRKMLLFASKGNTLTVVPMRNLETTEVRLE